MTLPFTSLTVYFTSQELMGNELAGRSGLDAVVDEILGSRGTAGRVKLWLKPSGLDQGRVALGGLGGSLARRLVALDGGEIELGVLLLEGVEIGHELGRAVVADVDEAVVVGLLGVLVDNTAGEDTGHLGAVDGADLSELRGAGWLQPNSE